MKVGFTGTRMGMSLPQLRTARELLTSVGTTELHHGDCLGADADMHAIAKNKGVIVVIHPPQGYRNRAFSKDANEIRLAKPYLDRDRAIVDETDCLIATPLTSDEWREPRSGTWATIRMARKKGVPIYIIMPNGSVRKENCDAKELETGSDR